MNNSTQQLIKCIQAQDKLQIYNNLEKYRENGIIKFENLLSIPFKDRLPGLVKEYGIKTIHGIIIIMLTDFCNYYNVIRPMTAEQIVDCAYEMINSSGEDYLSIEDFTIFFQVAKNGKYGKIYDRLDQQTIFDLLEVYRQERHEKYIAIKEEKESNYKAMGDKFRSCDDVTQIKDLFHQANVDYFKNKNNTNNVSE